MRGGGGGVMGEGGRLVELVPPFISVAKKIMSSTAPWLDIRSYTVFLFASRHSCKGHMGVTWA